MTSIAIDDSDGDADDEEACRRPGKTKRLCQPLPPPSPSPPVPRSFVAAVTFFSAGRFMPL
jgi:hypothetical protein